MINQEQLKRVFNYDPNTGFFTWKKKTANGISAGCIAGSVTNRGYVRIIFRGRLYMAHRLAWLFMNGEFPQYEIDHINHHTNDNRIVNLRSVAHIENSRNESLYKNNSSGVLGVSWHKGSKKWMAYISVEGKRIHLGYFTNKSDAILARAGANIKYGFHKNHGMK